MNITRTKSMHRLLGSLLLLITVVSIMVPSIVAEVTYDETDLTGVSVAIYGGGSSEGHNESKKALTEMFEWMNASSVEVIVGEDVRNGALEGVDIFVLPGSSPYTLYYDLETEGFQIFEDFIRDGGSFFGIVSGSYFEWDDYFKFNDFFLYSGRMDTPIGAYGYGQMTVDISVNLESEGPDLSTQPENLTTTYWDSGFFSDYDEDVNIIANYTGTDLPAMIAYEKWNGTVFLSTLHPEFEENSSRDNSTFMDSLDDPDSEWNLLLSVSRWLIEESIVPTETTGTTSSAISATSTTSDTQTVGFSLGTDSMVVIGIAVAVVIVAIVVGKKIRG
ncbi:MAG: hypothetical protein RTV72_04305 [Candidatus Thorarchaeota archaeon]